MGVTRSLGCVLGDDPDEAARRQVGDEHAVGAPVEVEHQLAVGADGRAGTLPDWSEPTVGGLDGGEHRRPAVTLPGQVGPPGSLHRAGPSGSGRRGWGGRRRTVTSPDDPDDDRAADRRRQGQHGDPSAAAVLAFAGLPDQGLLTGPTGDRPGRGCRAHRYVIRSMIWTSSSWR
jgi:hypothetical protein